MRKTTCELLALAVPDVPQEGVVHWLSAFATPSGKAKFVKPRVLGRQLRARLIGRWGASRNVDSARRLRERLSMKSVLLRNSRSF